MFCKIGYYEDNLFFGAVFLDNTNKNGKFRKNEKVFICRIRIRI